MGQRPEGLTAQQTEEVKGWKVAGRTLDARFRALVTDDKELNLAPKFDVKDVSTQPEYAQAKKEWAAYRDDSVKWLRRVADNNGYTQLAWGELIDNEQFDKLVFATLPKPLSDEQKETARQWASRAGKIERFLNELKLSGVKIEKPQFSDAAPTDRDSYNAEKEQWDKYVGGVAELLQEYAKNNNVTGNDSDWTKLVESGNFTKIRDALRPMGDGGEDPKPKPNPTVASLLGQYLHRNGGSIPEAIRAGIGDREVAGDAAEKTEAAIGMLVDAVKRANDIEAFLQTGGIALLDPDSPCKPDENAGFPCKSSGEPLKYAVKVAWDEVSNRIVALTSTKQSPSLKDFASTWPKSWDFARAALGPRDPEQDGLAPSFPLVWYKSKYSAEPSLKQAVWQQEVADQKVVVDAFTDDTDDARRKAAVGYLRERWFAAIANTKSSYNPYDVKLWGLPPNPGTELGRLHSALCARIIVAKAMTINDRGQWEPEPEFPPAADDGCAFDKGMDEAFSKLKTAQGDRNAHEKNKPSETQSSTASQLPTMLGTTGSLSGDVITYTWPSGRSLVFKRLGSSDRYMLVDEVPQWIATELNIAEGSDVIKALREAAAGSKKLRSGFLQVPQGVSVGKTYVDQKAVRSIISDTDEQTSFLAGFQSPSDQGDSPINMIGYNAAEALAKAMGGTLPDESAYKTAAGGRDESVFRPGGPVATMLGVKVASKPVFEQIGERGDVKDLAEGWSTFKSEMPVQQSPLFAATDFSNSDWKHLDDNLGEWIGPNECFGGPLQFNPRTRRAPEGKPYFDVGFRIVIEVKSQPTEEPNPAFAQWQKEQVSHSQKRDEALQAAVNAAIALLQDRSLRSSP
jgi:hypothetical protein